MPEWLIFGAMLKRASEILSFLLLLPVWFYRLVISPWTPPSCRHVPTCSQFAIDALRMHGPLTGLVISADRILRCRPGGTHGYDPVPRFIFRKYIAHGMSLRKAPRCNRLKARD
jgi:putative membrane protein insertion efficiency factor